ncbi:hypothetical protein [Methylobacterium sp. E-066]|uniref:hypothetical protein n=1 Tax=Methylobacterium sp. E-066 TaxID=2836584 RepID=UPI001FBA5E50|nr:hypothetical protein [Methylobacterium sp. E-066]MCJ2144794.1 hypothetical protein [Methylobacterium sp. E-066]
MKTEIGTAGSEPNGLKAVVEMDSRMTVSADILKEWATEMMQELEDLVSKPGFPAPIEQTAELPLHQREWPAVDAMIFTLREEGRIVRVEATQQVNASDTYSVKFEVTNPS